MGYLLGALVVLFAGWLVFKNRTSPRTQTDLTVKARCDSGTSDSENEFDEGLVSYNFDGPEFLTITECDFFGLYSRSEDSQYLVAWCDADSETGSSRGGYRDRGKGRVILLSGARIVWQKLLDRPNDGVVSNNGVVVIADWLFGNELKTAFYVLSSSGEALIEETLYANINEAGISSDGSLAWCTTLLSEAVAHSSKLFVFETSQSRILFSASIEITHHIERISRNEDKVLIEDGRGCICTYSSDGQLV